MINENELIPELLIGVQVFHQKWLVGRILSIVCGHVIVKFDSCEKLFQFPNAFSQFLRIYDEEAYKKLEIEYRNREIISKIEERKIESYVHFTNIDNLDSILQEGLIPISQLKSRGIVYSNNDVTRLDNRLDANSLSITFPNYQMFYRYRKQDCRWVVICYDAKYVAKTNCAYFAQNAASSIYRNKDWDGFTSIDAFDMLFEGKRDGLLSCETTNPQAEVMVRGIIPTEYIKDISFVDYSLLTEYESKYPHLKMCYNKYYFQPRRDYQKWRKIDGNQTSFLCKR